MEPGWVKNNGKKATLLARKYSENIRWERSWNVCMESFLNISECLFGLFPHYSQEIFTEYLTYDHPTFALHLQFTQTILNFIYIYLFCLMLCYNVEHVNYIYLVENVPRTFPEDLNCSTLREASENILQTLCVTWESI